MLSRKDPNSESTVAILCEKCGNKASGFARFSSIDRKDGLVSKVDDDDGGELDEEKGDRNNSERGHWKNQCDFIVSCLGHAVGLGNVWRFPFLCYKYGGGSFLIPYMIMLLFLGIPVFFLELYIGQYSGTGASKAFGYISPLFSGLGYAVVAVSLLLSFFYIVVVSWSFHYLYASFTFPIIWSECSNHFNTQNCYTESSLSLDSSNITTSLNTSDDYDDSNEMLVGIKHVSSYEEFWNNEVVGSTGYSWDNFGTPRLQSIIFLAISWAVVCISMLRGIKSSGKIIYVTCLSPYVVLVTLMIRGLTLPGAEDGLTYFITPKWEVLAGLGVWTDAATQVLFSLGTACGILVTLSSYCEFKRNCYRNAIFIALANSFTSIFSGIVVFAVLGFMAFQKGVGVDEVVQGGPGLAFIIYPEVVGQMAASNFWAIIFFFMLISLALGSIFGAFETTSAAIFDQFPKLKAKKSLIIVILAFTLFTLGLPFTCGGGIYMFNVFNFSAPSWNLLVFALLEVGIVGWFYGTDRVIDDLAKMEIRIGHIGRLYWKFCWCFATPSLIILLLIMSFVNFGQLRYDDGTLYPLYVQVLGYCLTGSTILIVPIVAFYIILKHRSRQPSVQVMDLVKCSDKWRSNELLN